MSVHAMRLQRRWRSSRGAITSPTASRFELQWLAGDQFALC